MGIFNWVSKKREDAKVTGKKIVNYDEIKKMNVDIKDMAANVLSPKNVIKNAKQENFQSAKKRLNVTDLDLIKNYNNFVYVLYIFLLFCVISIISMFYFLLSAQIMSALISISILSFFIANSFKFSFRAFQIKHQKLCSVKEWFDRKEEWFPLPYQYDFYEKKKNN